MASPNVCIVGMHFERPGAPRVYSRNTSVWSEYELARQEKYCLSKSCGSCIGEVDVKYIPEKPLTERLLGLSALHISKRKLPYRIYDYNYKVGSSYYDPQTEYIEDRDGLRKKVIPPECASFAERFASKPFYGAAYGLPYSDRDSALSQPLLTRRRSASAGRASRHQEPDDHPAHGRTGRGRDRAPRERRLSFSFDDEDFSPPRPRRKFSLADDLDFKIPISKYVDSDYGFRSSVEKERPTNHKIGIPATMSDSIKKDLKKLERQFKKADALERGTGGARSQQWQEVVFASDDPSKKYVKETVAYTMPTSGATVRKSSYQHSSRGVESSKPPRAPPRPSRILSIEDSSDDFKLPPRTRRRHYSISGDGDDFNFKFSSRTLKSDDNDVGSKMSSRRRGHDSSDLNADISDILNRMRKHSLGDTTGYSARRTARASSLDPEESRFKSRSVRSSNFTYGFSK